jgi:hypothetical protein
MVFHHKTEDIPRFATAKTVKELLAGVNGK